MSTLKRYKDMEKRLYRRGVYAADQGGRSLSRFLRSFFRSGNQKITIMLVPHSEKKSINIRLTRFALAGLLILAVAGAVGLLASVYNLGGVADRLASASVDLKETQSTLDAMRDNTSRLVKAAKKFEATLAETLGAVGIQGSSSTGPVGTGDLASFFPSSQTVDGKLKEISEIEDMTDFLERSTEQVKLLGQLYGSKNALNSIPTIWPVKSGQGLVSMYFGQNKNPFTNMWYIHKGLDINTRGIGDPICATADGEVIQAGFEASYGNFITIKHQFGFYTRYAHLQSMRVSKGQKVQQGQLIGYLGNTGLTTAAHLHYEIHLGTDVVDPLKYLNRPKPGADSPAGNL
jgi:murein DD-endopeptidase MepM/ murein hydrolase activator NlpD